MKKYVYLIHALDDETVKIGFSVSPQVRMKEISTSNSSDLKLLDKFHTEYYTQIETALHNRFSHLHKNGEWFYYDLTIMSEFRKICEITEKNLVFLNNSSNIFI